MATVTIGGRALEVKPETGTLGFERNVLIPWQQKLAAAKTGEEVIDLIVECVLLHVGQNDGVDAAWVLANVKSADTRAVLEACAVAAGRKVAAPGEAQSP